MKIAAGRLFYNQYAEQVQALVPHCGWALWERNGTWSADPQDCQLAVLVGDSYCPQFKEALLAAPLLQWVHTENSGTDGLFYETIKAREILLTNSPGANAREVAEFVLGMMLWSVKRFGALHDQQHQHKWQRLPLQSLYGATVLIVGLGHVGKLVAQFCAGFGMHVLGIRRANEPVAHVERQGHLADLPFFLPRADFVVLTLSLNPETQGVIGWQELQRMKPTSTLINVARSQIVDLQAVCSALEEQVINQAYLDVLEEEPWPQNDPLWEVPNLFITPHIAWSSPQYRLRAGRMWFENFKRYVEKKPLDNIVR